MRRRNGPKRGLSRSRENVQGSKVKIETSHRLGAPYEEIVRVAREREVDLIVIPTHGYTGLKHFLLGSTTERLVTSEGAGLRFIKNPPRGRGEASYRAIAGGGQAIRTQAYCKGVTSIACGF